MLIPTLLALSGGLAAAQKLDGACVIIKKFVPNENFQHPPDCKEDEDQESSKCKHDFMVEVWLNEGDKATAKQRTNVVTNDDAPEWNERLCWQSQMASINFVLYEDDTYNGQDEEILVAGITPKEGLAAKVKRRSRADLAIGLKNAENQIIGILYYATDVDDSLWGFNAASQTCHPDSLLVEVTEPDTFTPLKGGWITGPQTRFNKDGKALLLKRYRDSNNLCKYDGNVEGRETVFTKGQFYNAVALLPWQFHKANADDEECSPFDVIKAAEEAGAAGVIFYLLSNYGYRDTFMANYLANHPEENKATIPARWIENDDAIDIGRAWDIHEVEAIYVKISCPWEFEQDFMDEMCVQDTFFSGKYGLLKTKDADGFDVTVTVNDHAVWKSKDLGGGLPYYVLNTKNMDVNELGVYRWVVSTSLSAEFLLAICQETHRAGESMEPNDCENWKIYDKQYNQWQDHLLTIIDFCPRENNQDFDEVKCSHTAVQFQIDDAGPLEDVARSYPSVVSLFGPAKYETKSVELVLLTGENYEGCEDYDEDTKDQYDKKADVKGKIVIVSRGECYFLIKQLKAEEAGAIGLIVVNYEGKDLVYMSNSDTDAEGTIPMRMMSFENFKPIREGFQQAGPMHPFKGGFYCPQDTEEPPAELCIGQINDYTDAYGYHNDFHGTFVRLQKDFNEHAAYRLDPLSNSALGGKLYGTPTSGQVEKGIDHTKTYLYYDQGGVGDTGNSWKIGPTLGGGKEHVFAYCRGLLGEDIGSPADCQATGGTWLTYLPTHDPPDFYALNNESKMIYNGQCSWDLANGDGWHDLDDFDGIFCKKHKQCNANEYCMDCPTCLDKYDANNVRAEDMFTHPCNFCFFERDEKNSQDDAICRPLVSCSRKDDANKRDDLGDDNEDGEMKCVDACIISDMGVGGECPDFPGCDEENCKDTKKLWGNGVCNKECAGCPEWQEDPFDGTDCDGHENQIEAGQVYEFTGGNDELNLACSTVMKGDDGRSYKYTIQMIAEVIIKDMKGRKITMEFNYRQVGNVNERFKDTKRTLVIDALETSPVKWTGDAVEKDMDSKMRFYKFEGKLGKSEDYESKNNPDGFYLTMLPHSDAELPEGAHMDCDEFTMPLTGMVKDGGKQTPSPDPSGEPGEKKEGMALCNDFDKKNCKAHKDAKAGGCLFDGVAQGGQGLCMWVPDEPPLQLECTESGGGYLYIKGKGDAVNWKKQQARNAKPCTCLNECQGKYESKGPYVAFTLETGTKKGKDYAKCTCWKTLKKVSKAAGGEFQTGSVIPGYLKAWMKK